MKATELSHLLLSLFATASLISTSANAALVSRLGGLAVYDTDLNVTWLADTNYAYTSGYSKFQGKMTWYRSQEWISSLNAQNGGAGLLGFNDWRLPTTLQPNATCTRQNGAGQSYGYNCIGSEMGHLFYHELGGVANSSIATTHNANYSLFSNFRFGDLDYYWSGTQYLPSSTWDAWTFNFKAGYQGYDYKGFSDGRFALAVRTGDVATVPGPAAAWLLGSGLLGLTGIFRKRNPA